MFEVLVLLMAAILFLVFGGILLKLQTLHTLELCSFNRLFRVYICSRDLSAYGHGKARLKWDIQITLGFSTQGLAS